MARWLQPLAVRGAAGGRVPNREPSRRHVVLATRIPPSEPNATAATRRPPNIDHRRP